MKVLTYKEALNAFLQAPDDIPFTEGRKVSVETIGGGLINHSYKVSSGLNSPFLLQQLNQHVFTRPEDVQENYINIWQYAEFEFTGLHLPEPIYYDRQHSLYQDTLGNYWRAFRFIEDSKTLMIAEKPAQAKATAKAFARFVAAFEEFNLDELRIVIPGFHDLSARYEQFREGMKSEFYERIGKSMPLIEKLKSRERYLHFYEVIIESEEFPQRVMHHDAKISNVLFSQKTGRVICLVDMDTVMPGYFFSDLGDMIRSMACSHDEHCRELTKLHIRKKYYDAILEGYMQVMQNHFTASEKKYIHYAGIIMIYMQALRFMTDYLQNDRYYKTSYADQNFDRAHNQLRLLEQLEEFLRTNYHFSA